MILDNTLIDRARDLTGVQEKTALVHEGLRALIARESAKRLAALGGSEPSATSLGTDASGESSDKSSLHAKNRMNGLRFNVP